MQTWEVTYRWSLRRTYTVTAATAADAERAAWDAWQADDGADMAGQPDAFAVPDFAPDDVEVEPGSAPACHACDGAGVFASRSGGNVCECCGGTGHDTGCECAGCEAARAPRCHKCGRADDLHVQDGTATCHPCMIDDDLARHFADQRRRAAETADTLPSGMTRVSGSPGGDGIYRITY